jgi:phosphoribosylaminoimidazole-succinocarboxamide synthase
MGKEGQSIPVMTDEFVETVTQRYIELFEQVTGTDFIRQDYTESSERIRRNIEASISSLMA